MKTIPFNESFTIDTFVLTQEIIDRGYYTLSEAPEIDSVKFIIENGVNVMQPQYSIIQVDEDLQSLFSDVSINDYVVTWIYVSSSSSSSSECYLPDPIWNLEGTLYGTLEQNIGSTVQIRYVSQT